ncbi:MAG: 50S ribosomal protein L25 [Gammaproteobacteria bacterium]|nr:MAG: 50S ribosomal protein L25 [Gammaproteobacteria bacterium]RLA19622.1 MAG: 50S ribosomal protein L25 [Gammaproteobacteria bacterium]
MTSIFEFNATVRSENGTGDARRLRKAGKIPAVLYGGSGEAEMLTLEHHKVARSLEDEAVYSHILKLNIDGKVEDVILKAIQRHPSKPVIMHMDMLRVNKNEKIRVHVPLHFMDEENCPGVKQGGIAMHDMVEVAVSCLPADLPEYIEVDISAVELGGSIHLTDLKLPAGVDIIELMHGEDHDLPVMTVKAPRAVVEADDESAPEAEPEAEEKKADE